MKNKLPTKARASRLGRPAAIALTTLSLLTLAACGGNDTPSDPPDSGSGGTPEQEFEVTMTNLTAGQPLSPAVAIIHDSNYRLFNIGSPATVGLERLAEGAETEPLLAELVDQAAVKTSGTSTGGAVGPGASTQFVLTVPATTDGPQALRLSLASMLVNTNDAIATLNGGDLSGLAAGESMSISLISYDTGTEDNIETIGSMPGPAAGGEGFNAARDDLRDEVHIHAGVVTSEDGLATSVLTSIHRWQHPVARLQIRRIR
ncbi:MAG: spondin domain-containing protein [Burkholderiaceae bacterium]